MKPVEQHYSVPDLCRLLRFGDEWVKERIRAGEFGPVLVCGREYRVPASGVNAWLEQHTLREPASIGIQAARSVEELFRRRRPIAA